MVFSKNSRPSMLQLQIINELFVNKMGITIKQVSNNLKTDYKNTHASVEDLFKKGVVTKEKVGNYNICKLNYKNYNIIEYLKEYNHYIKVQNFRKKYPTEYRLILEAIDSVTDWDNSNDTEINNFKAILVFGSHAKNEEKEASDIDILVLTGLENNPFEKTLNKLNLPYQKKFHVTPQALYYFMKDLKKKGKLNVANEIYKCSPIVFYGDDLFFRLMIEASKLW